jgi:hypothetical protein
LGRLAKGFPTGRGFDKKDRLPALWEGRRPRRDAGCVHRPAIRRASRGPDLGPGAVAAGRKAARRCPRAP